MPIQYGVTRSPKGHEVFRTESTGEVDEAQAREYRERVLGEGAGKPLLAVIRRGVEMSAAARKEFSNISAASANTTARAFVVESAPLRVTMSFIFKVIGYAPKMFSNEPAAMDFLDAEMNGPR
jgi:hypothetical protein